MVSVPISSVELYNLQISGGGQMRKIIYTLVFTIIYTFGLASNSISSEIKTLDDFNKSVFFKNIGRQGR